MSWLRLYITVEGQAEKAFADQALTPHLANYNIEVKPRVVVTNRKLGKRGGILDFAKIQGDLTRLMRQDRQPEARFTTMLDLYALPSEFPGWEDARRKPTAIDRVASLEHALHSEFGDPRFQPYIQLHEFEALLYCDLNQLKSRLSNSDYHPEQGELEGIVEKPNIAEIVSRTTSLVVKEMIPIPRILVVPQGEVKSWFEPFELDLRSLRYPAPSKDLWVHNLHTDRGEAVSVSGSGFREPRMEDYVVSGLVDFDDISYDANADLLYDLASQTVRHFQSYLPEEEVWQVLHHHQKDIASFIHGQMHKHYREETSGYEVKISRGFTELKPSAFAVNYGQGTLDFRTSPKDKSNMAKYLFGGFSKCLYPVQKFQSDAERRLAVILERESLKWFKPAKGQFQIFYKNGADHPEYQPDFVAETETVIYMLEPKAKNELEDPIVQAKKDVAEKWCERATEYNLKNGGKPWRYALISHDKITENMSIEGLA